MIDRDSAFLDKALESLAGAESEFVNERYNNTANRAYYAVFHAAIAARRIRSSTTSVIAASSRTCCHGASATACR